MLYNITLAQYKHTIIAVCLYSTYHLCDTIYSKGGVYMKKILGVSIILLLIFTTTVIAETHTEHKVYTQDRGGFIYSTDGRIIYKDGKKLVDMSENKFTNYYNSNNIDARSVYVTDMSARGDGLYCVALAFSQREVDYNDSDSYEDGEVYIGDVHIIIFEVDKDNGDIFLRANGLTYNLWDTPYVNETYDTDDYEQNPMISFNYTKNLIKPKLIHDRYNVTGDIFYLLYQENVDEEIGQDHMKIIELVMGNIGGTIVKYHCWITPKYLQGIADRELTDYVCDINDYYIYQDDEYRLVVFNSSHSDYGVGVKIDIGYKAKIVEDLVGYGD